MTFESNVCQARGCLTYFTYGAENAQDIFHPAERKMLAFQGNPSAKMNYLSIARKNLAWDSLERWFDYFTGAKSCGIAYTDALGIPRELIVLEETIYANLHPTIACGWPVRFLDAIQHGADLSLVWHRFSYWLLIESRSLEFSIFSSKVRHVASLHRRSFLGDAPSRDEWSESSNASVSSEIDFETQILAERACLASVRAACGAFAAVKETVECAALATGLWPGP